MDITTLIGAIAGIIFIALGIMLRGGGGINFKQFVFFWNFPSMLITFGGTICAILVNYPLKQVIGVWKMFSVKSSRGYFAVDTERPDMLPCLFDICGVRVQSLDDIAVVYSQFGGQASIPTSEMDN